MTTTKVLFVCLGNICRSPMAEGIFRQLVEKDATTANTNHQYAIDSAGTGTWHIGNPPDSRAISTMQQKGIDISQLKARKVCENDFHEFDYIIAMDSDNYANLQQFQASANSKLSSVSTQSCKASLHRLLDFGDHPMKDVPDPYFGEDDGFIFCYQLITKAANSLKESIESTQVKG